MVQYRNKLKQQMLKTSIIYNPFSPLFFFLFTLPNIDATMDIFILVLNSVFLSLSISLWLYFFYSKHRVKDFSSEEK